MRITRWNTLKLSELQKNSGGSFGRIPTEIPPFFNYVHSLVTIMGYVIIIIYTYSFLNIFLPEPSSKQINNKSCHDHSKLNGTCCIYSTCSSGWRRGSRRDSGTRTPTDFFDLFFLSKRWRLVLFQVTPGAPWNISCLSRKKPCEQHV